MKYGFLFSLILLLQGALDGQVNLIESHLPLIKVYTDGQEIVDEPKILTRCEIISNSSGTNVIDDEPNEYEGLIGIEIRGQSSQWFDKKSYGIEFRDENGEDQDVEILGFPAEEDFVLHGPFSDKSLIRNAIAYTLGREVMEYAPRTRFIELLINDEYKGVYLLTERIKRDKNRIDIAKLNPEDVSGEELEGGYILRFDKSDSNNEILWYSPYVAEPGNGSNPPFLSAYPKDENILPEQRQYIEDYVTEFEDALASDDFEYEGKNYKDYIDIGTVIDYILLCEVLKNVDAYRISTYMYKDKGGELKLGPIWDFNLAMGNADYCEGGEPSGWQFDFNFVCPWDGWVNHFWWRRFFQDPEFMTQFQDRYSELRETVFSTESLHSRIDSLADEVGDAAARNFEQFDILGEYVWPNRFVGNTHEEEIQYLKEWMEERMEFIDGNVVNGIVTENPEGEIVMYPNPNTGEFILDMGELYLRSRIVHIYNSQGALLHEQFVADEVKVNVETDLIPGIYFVRIMNYKGVTLGPVKKLIIH